MARFRAGAAVVGRQNARVVNSVSATLGGGSTYTMNEWTLTHSAAALASSWYYILFQGAITGVVGAVILWRRVPTFSLQRNALVAITLLGLVAFWLYPVAPPRMLPGYHDIIAVTIPAFTSLVETNGAAQFASLPSLHVAWALWAAIALCTVVRKPLLRALVWLYPFVTIADVLATGNHYLLDIITAPGLLILGYAVALTPAFVRRLRHGDVWRGEIRHGETRHGDILHRPVLRYLSPQYLALYYLSVRNLLLPSLLVPSLVQHREACSSDFTEGQLMRRQHQPAPDNRPEHRLACTSGARPDHGRSSGQR